MELLKLLLSKEPRWPLSRNLSDGPVLRRTESLLLRLVVFRVYVRYNYISVAAAYLCQLSRVQVLIVD